MDLRRGAIIFCAILGSVFGVVVSADAALSRASSTYQQAQLANGSYFQLLSRYRGAIDMVDEYGNTAYCMALRDGNQKAQRLLISYGANPYHTCVKKYLNQRVKMEPQRETQQVQAVRQYRNDTALADNSKTYLWAGAGILALGGGIALAAGGGGGGGHSEKQTNEEKPGVDTPDDKRPNDEKPNVDNPNVDVPNVDNPNVDNPNVDVPNVDNPNGVHVPDEPKEETQQPHLGRVSAETFRTDEFMKSNFLEEIKAAQAYSHIYSQDEDGNLFSHQAGSDEALKKVKVGILDSGVYENADIGGKVVKRYDLNKFSGDESILMKANTNGSVQAYVIKKGGKYYLFHVHHEWKDDFGDYVDVFEPVWRGDDGYYRIGVDALDGQKKLNWAVSGDIVSELVDAAWNIALEDMTLVNAGDGFPGLNIARLDPNLTVDDLRRIWPGEINKVNHGSHVAGIIAARKNDTGMHGVAFDNAEILGASWDMYKNSGVDKVVKQMVDDGAVVINNSWGRGKSLGEMTTVGVADEAYSSYAPEIWNSYVYAAKNGVVWVQATGNSGHTEPDYYNGMGRIDLSEEGYEPSDTKVPYLAVAALDPTTKSDDAVSGELASYSNACGSAAGYCLAAPGAEILSTSAAETGNIYLSGTSMATPVVSGSIALLNGYYPWLNAQNIAYLLLETANKDGVYSNSLTYGRGALDLEAAITTPLGDLRLPESDTLQSLSSARMSRLSLAGPLQKQVLKAMPEKVVAFDVLDRPFEYETQKLLNTTHASNANLRYAVSKMAMGGASKTTKDEKTGFQFTTEEALNKGGWANLSSAEVLNETDMGAMRFYYAVNSKYATQDNLLKAAYNPYLAMNEAYGAENMLKLSDVSRLKFALQTGENGLYERDYEQDRHSFKERAYALSGEYSFNLTDYLEVAALGGMLFENDAMLGMNGTGMFGIRDSMTYYMGVKAALNLTADFSLLAAYYRGYTQGGEAALLLVSDLETESFMLAGEYKLNQTDKVGLSLSSPLSVVRGKASVLFARGRDNYSDRVYMQKLTSSLKPEAKEYDLGMYYQGQPKENINLLGKVEARFNADGEKGVTDYIGMIGAGVAF